MRLYMLICLPLFVTTGVNSSLSYDDSVVIFRSTINNTETYVVNGTARNLHVLQVNSSSLAETETIRIITSVPDPPVDWEAVPCPVLFTLTQDKSSRSWALPINENTVLNRSLAYTSDFTACMNNSAHPKKNIELSIFVSTCNQNNVTYSLTFTTEHNVLTIDNSVQVEVSPTSLHFYSFRFPADLHVDRVVVRVESNSSVCMTAAVQSPWCGQLNEHISSEIIAGNKILTFNTFWQDMNTRAAIPVSTTDFASGFFIGFMVHSSQERCDSYKGVTADSWTPIQSQLPSNQKLINITIIPALPTGDYNWRLLYPPIYAFTVAVITIFIYVTFHCVSTRMDFNERSESRQVLVDNDELAQNTDIQYNNVVQSGHLHRRQQSNLKSLFSKPLNQESDDDEVRCPFSEGKGYAFNSSQQGHQSGDQASAGPSSAFNSHVLDKVSAVDNSEDIARTCPFSSLANPRSTHSYHAALEEHVAKQISIPELVQDKVDQGSLQDEESDDEAFSLHPNEDNEEAIPNVYQSIMENGQVTVTVPQLDGASITEEQAFADTWLRMDAFLRKRKVKKSLDRVYLLIGAIGIFYGLPTVQLLVTYYRIGETTGNKDLCYRNYLCSHRYFWLDDFNHIYSNIVYVLLAIVFCVFVRQYENKVNAVTTKLEERNSEVGIGHGVVHQFGIFYALGLAFGLEGLLSALYHVCPTEMNFQFDTSFMFILAALTTIKIYQFRHPNPICPHNTLGLLAMVSFMSVGGIILGSKVYEGLFIALQVVLLFILSIYLYYLGYLRDEDNNPVTGSAIFTKSKVWSKLRGDPFVIFKPDHKSRLCFLIPLIVFNLAINISQMIGTNVFPTYLVYIFAGNMMLYFLYYCIMKVYHGEAFTIHFIQPFIYLVFSFSMGILAILYFVDKNYNPNLPPAASRALNADCIVEEFYDSHDVWHVLSAGSIFFFFMTLLTLDDGILTKPRLEIVTF